MSTAVRVKGMAGLKRALRKDLQGLRTRVLKAIHETAADGVDIAIETAPVAFGQLVSSIHDIPRPDGATIRADAPHAAAVEWGSRPHRPPIWPLKKWCELKGIPVEVAWAIQAKIAKVGTKPTWFMGRSVPAVEAILATRIGKALAD